MWPYSETRVAVEANLEVLPEYRTTSVIFDSARKTEENDRIRMFSTGETNGLFCNSGFKRLNNGMWIHAHPGKNKLRYMKDDTWQVTSNYLETCTKAQCEMLDKLVTPFWLRQKHYPNDPYQAYYVRHGISSPRVDDKGRFLRERKKVLLDDTISEKFFKDR